MRVAIAGAGIAGLTSAIALAARGFQVDVFERAPALEEIGAGIQLSPNAMAVLQQLGVAENLSRHVSEPEALMIRDAVSSAPLARIPLGAAARERYGAPYCTLHRADLQTALAETVRKHPTIALHLGAEVRDVSAAANGVAFAAAGVSQRSEILVAADGVRSAIRTGYFRHPGPQSLGRSAWRATLPAQPLAGRIALNEVGLWLGPGAHLVHYPIAGGTKLNVVVIGAREASTPPLSPFGTAARQLIDTAGDWVESSLLSVNVSRSWVSGRVALIGDAAHGMAPSAAQGGAQAIEDAWSLAACLSRERPEPVRGLAAYERLRRPRVERVASLSARNLKLYEMKGVPASLRNSVLRISPARLLISRLDWLFRSSI
jgi:salicylate hydroxylase